MTLANGPYAEIRLADRTFARAVVIDASNAVVTGFLARNVDGLHIRGGQFRLPPPRTNPKNGRSAFGQALRIIDGITTQGIGMSSHMSDGVRESGYNRIPIEDNDINVDFPNAVGLNDARVHRPQQPRPDLPRIQYAARINIRGDGDVKRCGNVVQGGVGKRGSTDLLC